MLVTAPKNVPAETRGRDHVRKGHTPNGWGGIELRSPSAILARLGGPLLDRKADHTQAPRLEPTPPNGWGGIRTHEGINPHDFQSCALSRSATHPSSDQTGDPKPTSPSRFGKKRREWDSNPRGLASNALAGRRLKPLGHPSHNRTVAPLGLEPRLSGTRIRRVASYTKGQRATCRI